MCSADATAFTLEQQRAELAAAKQRAKEAAAAVSIAADAELLITTQAARAVRERPLGVDRDSTMFWDLSAVSVFTAGERVHRHLC